jgi:RNA polymerase sigma-70 factor (ECF subfamily)
MAVEGHEAALDTLFGQHRPHLYQTALRLCGNPEDAEDALQDGLFSAFRHLRYFEARSQFSTWLTRIVINATLMQMRRRGRHVMISVDSGASNEDEFPLADALRDVAPDPETAYVGREAFELFRSRLQSLPQACQEIVWLRGVQGFSTEEAANTLGVSKGTIKSALHRARAKLVEPASATTPTETQLETAAREY